jgi:hypothetical protein
MLAIVGKDFGYQQYLHSLAQKLNVSDSMLFTGEVEERIFEKCKENSRNICVRPKPTDIIKIVKFKLVDWESFWKH